MRLRLPHCAVVLACVLCGHFAVAAEDAPGVYVTPEAAAADPDFALQGEYLGTNTGVQIVAQGKGAFLAVIHRGGLPGAGWNGTEKQETEETTADVRTLIKDLSLKKVERKSPTLGAKAPAGSIVLFDGQAENFKKHWQPGAKFDQGLLHQGATSTDKFTDFQMHIEFRLPFMPAARGQGRGNSGVYYQGRHESQMLDSFGLAGTDHECAGFYEIKAPDVNMCLPPLTWQTYDVEYTAARFGADGKKTANARVTVRQNGVVVQQDVEMPGATRAAPLSEGPEPGPLYLQEHGSPVRFRNIWVLPLSAEQEAKRPIVPGFERFHAATGADPAVGGRLLLGELNCVACHQADDALARHLLPRPAPILDDVGQRIHPEYLLKYLADPHTAKPGTLMPDLLSALPVAERDAAVLALVNFLVSTGTVAERGSDLQSAQRGQKLFKEIGCLACHAPRDAVKVSAKTTVPLGDLPKKYSISSLAAFLQNPHQVRPAGRMPNLIQKDEDAVDLASYLIGPVDFKSKNPNWRFAVYHGSWSNVPNYDDIQPVKQGECAGFNLLPAGRANDYGMRYAGFLKINQPGDYQFHIGSDDGSLLFIDGQKVADSDGVHPHTVQSGRAKLSSGMHAIRVDYAQVAGEATLTLEYEGPGVPRQDINRNVFLTEKGPEPKAAAEADAGFRFDPALADKGRTLFASVGCANCHQFKHDGQPLKSLVAAPELSKLRPDQGCLAASGGVAVAAKGAQGSAADLLDAATKTPAPVPRFDLNSNQRTALTAALVAPAPAGAPKLISQMLTAFNCYGCHARDGIGGPERDRNPLFLTTIPEMGDEGRVPPQLDGVGDKLTAEWLQHVLQNGAKDRPYMLTRMPKFSLPKVRELTEAFVAEDRWDGASAATLTEAEHRVKAIGRQLVGDKALGCIKCHTFGEHRASGIQAINLQTMTQRIRQDWFLRYMINPQTYRPGTRMPTGFPGGKATIRDIYEGNTDQQLASIWTFLKDGGKAGLPEGLLGNVIELKPETKPILYRNFIEGLTPRGIAVGYPERAHLAWDANKMCLTLIWHGRFIDAGKHWEGRGPGFQGPLGDHVMKLEETVPLAVLESPTAAWPSKPPREAGYQFRGYELDKEGRPHFHYTTPNVDVQDFPKPVTQGKEAGFERRLTITAKEPVNYLYFRAGSAGKIEAQPDGSYLIDGNVRIRLPGTKPVLRESGGRQELLIPVVLTNGKAEIVQEISW